MLKIFLSDISGIDRYTPVVVRSDGDWPQLEVYLYLEVTIHFCEKRWVYQESLHNVGTQVCPDYCALGLKHSNSCQTRGYEDKQAGKRSYMDVRQMFVLSVSCIKQFSRFTIVLVVQTCIQISGRSEPVAKSYQSQQS